MKTKNILLALCLVVLGIAIGFYLARKVFPPEKVIAMRFNPVGEMIVGAKAGDHLKWFNAGAPAAVVFKGLNPCTIPGAEANGDCIMKDSGVYKFKCTAKGCPDPGVGGGDDMFQAQAGARVENLDLPYADPPTVRVYCDPATSKAMADDVQGKQGTAFTIQALGTGPPDFTATFPAGTCDPGDALSSASPNCRIKRAVTEDTPYTYGIKVQGCTDSGTATLKVLKP